MQNTEKKLWVVIGDIHDDCSRLHEIPEISEASGIIVSGDLTFNGGIESADKVMSRLTSFGIPVYAQVGNMDKPEITEWLKKSDKNLHTEVRWLSSSAAVFGIGGSTPTPFNTPCEFSEEQYADWLADAWKKAENAATTILISHNPPKETSCDFIPGPDIHVGSVSVRNFIETFQPSICICGHIHEAKAQEKLGKTHIVNPGTLSDGGYVLLHISSNEVSAELKQLP